MQPSPSSRAPSSSSRSNALQNIRKEEEEEVKPYVIVTEIGKGSFATVYRGYHEDNHKQVAIKTVTRDKLSAKLFDNLQSEIQILKLLSHRHITKLIDIVRAQHYIYLIMEFCSGGDLTNYIKKRGKVETLEYIPSPGAPPQFYPHPRSGGLDEIVVRSFLRQLARALKFLRQRNLIHRDIKPQNLLLNPASTEELARGHPLGVPILKVADFGFARSLPNAMMAETLCGSPLYMAPEILEYKKYDAKADLWSVGAVLYEMSVGKPPFRAQNHIELLAKIQRSKGIKFPDEDPRPGTTDVSSVPADIKKLIRMLLKSKPVERANFEEFFNSTALAKSKFPRPQRQPEYDSGSQVPAQTPRPPTPDTHRVIPPEVLDENAMIPPSRFNFRRQSTQGPTPAEPMELLDKDATVRARFPLDGNNMSPQGRPGLRKLLSTEGSNIAGETDEDGVLRREYVMVGDTQAVEFNRAIDELDTAPRRPLHDRKIPAMPAPETPLSEIPPSHANITFPPPPNPYAPPELSSSPSSAASRAATNALNRALSLASKKLFGATVRGSPPTRDRSAPSSPRRPQIISLDPEGEQDPLEDQILGDLEDLAQKTDVLTRWADEMFDYVKAVPQKPLANPAKFTQRAGEADKQARRRKHADTEAEYNAVTCVAVYMLLMSFSQKGINKLRNYQEHMRMRHPDGDFVVSEGFDDALSWFKEHFVKCSERAALVKAWLPAQYDGAKSFLDQLVYDRALVLSRTAARKELLDQASPDECEKLYEESLWCLYALQDDLLQAGNPFMEEDRATIATWVKRTKLRLVRCRARKNMNAQDRMQDVRADQNLVDVARVPAPWE